ncbi:MAG: ABC transporter permease subunit [Clostridia bacterium]|nr:ABC transporter permease subunit [Clostridia bacterium]
MRKIGIRAAKILAALFFWIALWQILAMQTDLELILPAPLAVFRRLWELLGTGSFYATLGASFLRIGSGYLLGTAAGALLALAAWKLPPVKILLDPLMTVVRATPVASFIIVVILWLPREGVPAFIAALLVLPLVWQNTLLGLTGMDPALGEMATVFGIRGRKRFFRVEIPQVMPAFTAAAQTGLGLAWKAGVAAEVLALPKVSIGKMIYEAKQYLETPDLYAWTLAIILLSLGMEALFKKLFGKGGSRL